MGVHEKIQKLRQENTELRDHINYLEKQKESLVKMAFLDHLTNLNNRRAFEEHLRNIYSLYLRNAAKGVRTGHLSICQLDLIGFKKINDNLGYSEGDKTLKKVAQILKRSVKRESDTVAHLEDDHTYRYGGDEFGLILPETDFEGLKHLFKKIRNEIQKIEKWKLSIRISAVVLTGNEILKLKIKPRKLTQLVDNNMKESKKRKDGWYIVNYNELKKEI